MALINCSECGKQISDKAYTCPHCGAPLNRTSSDEKFTTKASKPKKKRKKWLTILIVLVIFAVIGKIAGSGSDENSENTTSQKTEVETPIWEKFDLTEEQWASFNSIFEKVGFTEITKVEKEEANTKTGVVPYYVEMKGVAPNKVISPGKTEGNIIYVEINPEKKLHEITVNGGYVYKGGKVLNKIRAYTEMTAIEQGDCISMAKQGVLQILKAPSTAKFCKTYEYRFGKEKGIVTTVGYVDAQNSFGAMIRSEFIFKYDCVAEKAISITLDGVVYPYKD